MFCEIAKTPLLIAHGDQDTTVPYAYGKEIYDGVTAEGGEVRFETLERYAHNIRNKCFETEEYWQRLFSHTRAR